MSPHNSHPFEYYPLSSSARILIFKVPDFWSICILNLFPHKLHTRILSVSPFHRCSDFYNSKLKYESVTVKVCVVKVHYEMGQRCICLLKINISAQPLKMALHKNVGVKAGHMVIFLHEKVILLHGSKIKHFFCTVK